MRGGLNLQALFKKISLTDQAYDDVLDAASTGETERLRALLERNPRLRDARTDYQGVPLFSLAAAEGHIDTVQLLLEHGCSLEDRDHGHIHGPGKTPLLAAAKAGQLATVVWLLEHGAHVNDSGGAQMLWPQALSVGWPEEQHKQEMYSGEDGDWNDSGWTALVHAADSGDATLCAALLWRGADPGRHSRHGLSALDLAYQGCLAAEQPDQAAGFYNALRLLAWAGGQAEQHSASMLASLPREALQLAPAALKECWRTLALCLRRLGLPHDAAEVVLTALLVVAMRG